MHLRHDFAGVGYCGTLGLQGERTQICSKPVFTGSAHGTAFSQCVSKVSVRVLSFLDLSAG